MLREPQSRAAMSEARTPAERVRFFGAILTRSVRGPHPYIVGGSAITVLTDGRYVSEDADVRGSRPAIVPVLRSWSFTQEGDPDGRVGWVRPDLGLVPDVLGRTTGRGFSGKSTKVSTARGPLWLSSTEDLIIRRLVFRSQRGTSELMEQAVMLYQLGGARLDADYLERQVGDEHLQSAYDQMRRITGTLGPGRR